MYIIFFFCSVSKSQLFCLLSLSLPELYCTLELFVKWISINGTYDFSELPLVMKQHLDPENMTALQNLDVGFKGKPLCAEHFCCNYTFQECYLPIG